MKKQRWEESEKRRREKIREEKESEDQRRKRVRTKKMQVCEKAEKARNAVCYSKVLCRRAKAPGSEPYGWMGDENCTPSWHISKSKCTKLFMFGTRLEVEMLKACIVHLVESEQTVRVL